MRLIDADHLMSEVEELKTSPWFNDDTNGARLIRREAINIVEDLCILKEPTVQAVPQWIPVSERRPEEGSCVLVCCKDGDIWMDDYYSYGFDDCGDDVIAWMPLPEPYKAESEGEE